MWFSSNILPCLLIHKIQYYFVRIRYYSVRQCFSLMLFSGPILYEEDLMMKDIEEMRKQLGFTNDFVFCTVMEENPDLCEILSEQNRR